MHILSVYNKVKNQEMDRIHKTNAKGSRGGRHFVDVTDPQVEKRLNQGAIK